MLFVLQICDGKNYQKRRKRSDAAKFIGPRFLSLAAVFANFVNRPPVLDSANYFSMFEDEGTLVTRLRASDPDGDEVFYRLDNSHVLPLKGQAKIDSTGNLQYRPCQNCYGNEVIVVQIIEKRTDGEEALITSVSLTIEVIPVNDSPELFVLSYTGEMLKADPWGTLKLTVEQNTITNVQYADLLFVIGAFDVDGKDDLETLHINGPTDGMLQNRSLIHNPALHLPPCGTDLSYDMSQYFKSESRPLPVPCNLTDLINAEDPGWMAMKAQYTPVIDIFGNTTIQVKCGPD